MRSLTFTMLLTLGGLGTAVNAGEPTACDEVLRTGTLPWHALRRVRELALAHVQVAYQIGSSDLSAPRIVVFPGPHAGMFTVWAGLTDPKQVEHHVHLVLDADFRVAVAHVRAKPDNQAAQALADWDAFEQRTAHAPGRWPTPPRMVMLFVGPAGPVATLEPTPQSEYFAPLRRVIPLRNAPVTAPRPPVTLSPARLLNVQTESAGYVRLISPGARLLETNPLRDRADDAAHARVQVEVRVAWPGADEERRATFWVLIDEGGGALIDLGEEPGPVANFTALHRAVREHVRARAPVGSPEPSVTGVTLVRTAGLIRAYVDVFRLLKAERETYAVDAGGGLTRAD